MAVTSWRFASSGANVGTIGSMSWASPEDIVSDDANLASADSMPAGTITNWLRAYFGFTTSDVPVGSTIDGIESEVDTFGVSAFSVRFYAARLVIGGTIGGTNVSGMPSTNWGGAGEPAPLTLGGASNLWASAPTASDCVGATFGVAIAAENYEAEKSRHAAVDYIKMRIYYTLGAGDAVGGASGGRRTADIPWMSRTWRPIPNFVRRNRILVPAWIG